MPITLPNLDDRRYADLVEEARDLVVANAPDLTNHNPTDPLITLTENCSRISPRCCCSA